MLSTMFYSITIKI